MRREQGNIVDIEGIKSLLTWNKWQTDPYSNKNAGSAIASRFDLMTSNVYPIDWLSKGAHGSIDSKVSNFQLGSKLGCEIISGPTHANQVPFEWTEEWKNITHLGHPQKFDFGWLSIPQN